MNAREMLLNIGFDNRYNDNQFFGNNELLKENEIFSLDFTKDVLYIYYNCNEPQLTIEMIEAIHKYYVETGAIKTKEVTTIYGYPVNQVILWAQVIRESGISGFDLKAKTDMFKLGYDFCDKEYKKTLSNVANQFNANLK